MAARRATTFRKNVGQLRAEALRRQKGFPHTRPPNVTVPERKMSSGAVGVASYRCRILLGCMFASFCLLSGGAWEQVITEFSIGSTAGFGPEFIAAGPDGNLWFTEISAAGSVGLPRSASSRSSAPASAPPRCSMASRRARMATCGSRNNSNAGLAGLPRLASSPSSAPASAPTRTFTALRPARMATSGLRKLRTG